MMELLQGKLFFDYVYLFNVELMLDFIQTSLVLGDLSNTLAIWTLYYTLSITKLG